VFLDGESFRKLAMALGAGIEVAASVFGGLAIGWFLDKWTQRTGPWLTLLFGMLGLAAGFYKLYSMFSKSDNDSNSEGQ
jgi:F0F1-type ATP synthase assembly protein I